MAKAQFSVDQFRVVPGNAARLAGRSTEWSGPDELDGQDKGALKDWAKETVKDQRKELSEAQERLYADDRYSLLLVFQGRDAAGKDSTIKHVMSGINPQGCQVTSFKAPSKEELDHNYLWRCWKAVPERGRIGIWNRSHYEEVLVVRVHPQILSGQRIPQLPAGDTVWQQRFEDINGFERHLSRNGTVILKFYLNVSKDEQKRRFLDRLNEEDKHWKFSARDVAERGHWDAYSEAFEDAVSATSTDWAPWYVIPADNKWLMRAIVARAIVDRLDQLDLNFPTVSDEDLKTLTEARRKLESE